MNPSANANALRLRALALYKELHRLGRDYPDPAYAFHAKLRGMYLKNKDLREPAEIERALALGAFVRDETLALIRLSKYRHLRRAYPAADASTTTDTANAGSGTRFSPSSPTTATEAAEQDGGGDGVGEAR